MKTHPLCRFVGHKLDVDGSSFYGVEYCERCQELVDGERLGLAHAKVWLRVRWRQVKQQFWWMATYIQRCPECGRRFHRHDDAVDHLPF